MFRRVTSKSVSSESTQKKKKKENSWCTIRGKGKERRGKSGLYYTHAKVSRRPEPSSRALLHNHTNRANKNNNSNKRLLFFFCFLFFFSFFSSFLVTLRSIHLTSTQRFALFHRLPICLRDGPVHATHQHWNSRTSSAPQKSRNSFFFFLFFFFTLPTQVTQKLNNGKPNRTPTQREGQRERIKTQDLANSRGEWPRKGLFLLLLFCWCCCCCFFFFCVCVWARDRRVAVVRGAANANQQQ